jgi:hypothetical protein
VGDAHGLIEPKVTSVVLNDSSYAPEVAVRVADDCSETVAVKQREPQLADQPYLITSTSNEGYVADSQSVRSVGLRSLAVSHYDFCADITKPQSSATIGV